MGPGLGPVTAYRWGEAGEAVIRRWSELIVVLCSLLEGGDGGVKGDARASGSGYRERCALRAEWGGPCHKV